MLRILSEEEKQQHRKDLQKFVKEHHVPAFNFMKNYNDIAWSAKREVFERFEQEVRKFRLKRTGQQEVSMMVRKLRAEMLGEI